MPNTDHHQRNPDFFSSKEEGKSCERVNTNPRYKFFKQTHFTAGDYEQFLEYWDRSSHDEFHDCSTPHHPMEPRRPIASFYQSLTCNDIMHTFEYIFHKYKKGIFFKIVKNELLVFLPFSKIEYTNDWSGQVQIDPQKYRNIYDLFEKSCQQYSFDPNRIHFMKDHWYANNGLLRYEYPISENDSGVSTLRDMLMTLCRERQVPDGEYFINKRDFPILKKNRTEAYECIYGEDVPLVSHSYEKYCPILSMTTTNDHADIPIPTWDDWGRVMYPQKIFGKDFIEYPDPYIFSYRDKKATAVFRGASTGLGTTLHNNPRLYFTHLSQQEKCDDDGVPFLDCAITKWNCRPRRSPNSPYYDTIDPDLIRQLGTGNFLSMKEQAQYKFILHLPGHSEAYRLSMELATGSVILLYPSRYQLWYSSLLREYEHYVPLDPSRPDDIYHKIQWCKQHEDECEKIASNARRFYENHLSKSSILDYLQGLLLDLQQVVGKIHFPSKNMVEFQMEREKETLKIEQKIIHNPRLFPFFVEKDLLPTLDLRHLHPRSFQIFLHKMDPTFIMELIQNTPIWKQSKNVMIQKITIAHRVLCVKTPHTILEKDLSHECFIGQVGVNKLANVCPMMLFQYGRWGNHILTDFVEGETLEKFLHQQKTEHVCWCLRLILSQLSILLHYVQAEMGFLHYDLYPWNIIIHNNTENTSFSFPIYNSTKTIDFQPPFYPVLIDFGKSHMVYKNIHFANISPFHLHLHQDIVSILVSAIYIVVQHHKLSRKDVTDILYLINYIGQTSYTRYKKFETITQVKQFLKLKKKYSNMLLDDKTEFKHKDPILLWEYIPPMSFFHVHKKISGLTLSLEVFYSRFVILSELACFFPTTFQLYETFQKERQPIPKNPLQAFYNLYLDYHIMSIMFPTQCDVANLVPTMISMGKKDWKLKEKPIADIPLDIELPRFFSHPSLETLPSGLYSVNHYYERHKVVSILLHASHHPSFSFLLEKIKPFFSYLQPILVANKHVSIANHLSLYQESLH